MMKDRSTGQHPASATKSDPHREFAQLRADFLNAMSGGARTASALMASNHARRRGDRTARRGAGLRRP